MKKFFLTLTLACISIFSFGQVTTREISKNEVNIGKGLPKVYLGLGTGINNYTGIIGIGMNVRLSQTFFLRGGAGIGSWGYKYTIGLRYERKYTSGWAYGLSYSGCSGLTNFNTNLEVNTAYGNVQKQVNMDLLSTGTGNLTIGYNWVSARQNDFFLEFGYAFPFQQDPYIIKDNSVITETSKRVMRIVEPGGLILGVGMMFGL